MNCSCRKGHRWSRVRSWSTPSNDTPQQWTQAAITAYSRYEAIVRETNNRGDLVEMNLKAVDTSIPFKAVHASRGKSIRAEPISALCEQGKVHHFGTFPELEDQLCEWVPCAEKSPDRLDALAWAISKLSEKTDIGKFNLSGLVKAMRRY